MQADAIAHNRTRTLNTVDPLDMVTLENLDQPLPIQPGTLQGRTVTMNWKTAQALAIATLAAATIVFKVYNITHWESNPLDVIANIGLGFEARLLLPHLVSEDNLKSIMNFTQRYSLDAVMVLTQFYLNAPSSIPLLALNQSVLTFFNSLLGVITTDSLITAFTLKQGDLDNWGSHSDKPLPLLSGDAQNWKHFLLYTALKVSGCVSLLIPKDKYNFLQASGTFLGANACGAILSFLAHKYTKKEDKRVKSLGDPHEKPSWLARALKNFATFNKVTHPIVIAFTNALLPKFISEFNADIGIAGFLSGFNSQQQKVLFQQCLGTSQDNHERQTSTADRDPSSYPYLRTYNGEAYIPVPTDDVRTASIVKIGYQHLSDDFVDEELEEERSDDEILSTSSSRVVTHLTEDSLEVSLSEVSPPQNAPSIMQRVFKSFKTTAAKVQNYAKLRMKEIGMTALFTAATLFFTIWGLSFDNASERDIISGICIVGGMFLSYIFTLIISAKFDPQSSQTNRQIEPSQSALKRLTNLVMNATKNTIFEKTIVDPYMWVYFFLLLSSLRIGSDDKDFQDSDLVKYIMQNFALTAYGANWGLHRVKADSLNRPDRATASVMALSILATVAYLQAINYYNQQTS